MRGLRTPLCDLLGIDVPIIQAPIGSATTPALAAAVSNAGGLGMLALSWTDPDGIRRLLAEIKRLTSRPFGVNLVLQWPQTERLHICLEEGVPLVSFHWGDAAPHVGAVHALERSLRRRWGLPRRLSEAPMPGLMSSSHKAWKLVDTSEERLGPSRSCRPSWMRSLRRRSWPQVASPTGVGSPLRWRWALPACGSARGSWRHTRQPPTRATRKRSVGPVSRKRSIPPCSTEGGPMRPIAPFGTARCDGGRGTGAQDRGSGPEKRDGRCEAEW